MTKEWTCPHCGGRETWFDRTITCRSDGTEEGMKTRCVKCGRTDERKELILSEVNRGNLDIMVRNLDGLRIGRMGINKCTACDDVWLTVYDADAEENDKAFFKDDQLSFRPAELLAFCREVIRVANDGLEARRKQA
jgi:predicted RNA-binding Zn-ribbon protein involved in translation (DUF1610 family)